MSNESDMFSRWSQRKRRVAAEAEVDAKAEAEAKVEAEADAAAVIDPELTEDELLEQLGLPNPDEMEQGDDFSAFLRSDVPEMLKKRALRRLWRSNPVLANLDGLIDHGEDYTDAATVPETMNTLYQVGKGMLRHVAEAEPAGDPEVDPEVDRGAGAAEPPLETDVADSGSVGAAEGGAENAAPQDLKTNGINQETEPPLIGEQPHPHGPENGGENGFNVAGKTPDNDEEKPFYPRRMAFRSE